MSDNMDVKPVRQEPKSTEKIKPGPKGRILEPYAREVLFKAREGQSMQDIVNWLAESPRCVVITRQAVHLWVRARVRKLEKLNAVFINTGLGGPFQESEALWNSRHSERPRGLDPPQLVPIHPVRIMTSEKDLPVKRIDMSEFMTEESELHRVRNPFQDSK